MAPGAYCPPLAVDNAAAMPLVLTAEDFERARRAIRDHAGIRLRDNKRELVYSRLSREVRRLSLPSFTAYLDQVESGDCGETERFVNALTTNLTSFFREAHHFDLLAEKVFAKATRPLRIWSCASSTGEEPYSIAMTALRHFGDNPPVRILATDIDTEVLKTARAGIYPLEKMNRLDAEARRRFFLRGENALEGWAKVKPEVTKLVEFRPFNLQQAEWKEQERFDAIFCRNVMIYFDKATQYEILQKMRPLLKDDGLLFAGHSESFFHAKDLFAPAGRTVYRPTRGPVTTAIEASGGAW